VHHAYTIRVFRGSTGLPLSSISSSALFTKARAIFSCLMTGVGLGSFGTVGAVGVTHNPVVIVISVAPTSFPGVIMICCVICASDIPQSLVEFLIFLC
jgi:hypothetical protein